MNLKAELLGEYSPRASIYRKTNPKGVVDYYMNYYLPGRSSRVARFLSRRKSEAKELLRVKESKLLKFEFDSLDMKRISKEHLNALRKPRFTLDEALERYMQATAYNRRGGTNQNTHGVLKNQMGKLDSVYIDEVTAEKAQIMAGMLKSEGLSDPTVLSYVGLYKSFFNWLIEDAEALDGRNPFSRVKTPPRSSKVCNRLVEPEAIKKILQVEKLSCREGVPIIPLVRFLLTTGCRLGEALHAEWGDFDLQEGYWSILIKPECPSLKGEGWYPKWKKPRVIKLLPQALHVLKTLPCHRETWGSMKVGGKTEYGRANFVFTSSRKVEIDGVKEFRQMRIGYPKRAWGNLLNEAGIQKMQIKSIRKFFNWVLVTQARFSHKEAGAYLGNSEVVNHDHYTPICLKSIESKLKGSSFLPQIGL